MTGAPRRFHGWTSPGPRPPGGVEVEEGETLDALSGDWKVFQLAKGHRYSTDDLLVAWYGTTWAGRVERALDLGSGIGSVAMLAAWRLPGARFVTIEAQEESLRLARKSVRYNGLEERFTLLHGDIRDEALLDEALAAAAAFDACPGAHHPAVREGRAGETGRPPGLDLVLGSPPYYLPGTATPAESAQAVPARIEVRGDVADYARAAARVLTPGGTFACVHPAHRADEASRAMRDAGLVVVRARDVVFREGEGARIRLYASARAADVPEEIAAGPGIFEPPLVIRLAEGARSPEFAAIRLTMGFPPGPR